DLMKSQYISCAAISHDRAYTTYLIDHNFPEVPFERNPSLDPFRYQFFDIVLYILKIAIFGPAIHGTYGSHTPVGFKFPTFVNDSFTRGLIHAGKQRTGHYGICTCHDGFDDVSRKPDASISDDGDTR